MFFPMAEFLYIFTILEKMAIADGDFKSWLSTTLTELNTDESVFGTYITGILESDESFEEKAEALQELLTEIVQNAADLNRVKNDILEKWHVYSNVEDPPPKESTEDVDTKLVKLLESQCLATTKQKEYTDEQKKIREAILSQYSRMTDDEDDNDDSSCVASSEIKGKESLEKNTNAQMVTNAEKLKREQAKLDSQKKKEKDREDREKQKQMREEKKEKRKTQKGERRR